MECKIHEQSDIPEVSHSESRNASAKPIFGVEQIQPNIQELSTAAACTTISILCVLALCIPNSDKLPGPTWLLSMLAYAPCFYILFASRHSAVLMFLSTFIFILSILIIIPAVTDENMLRAVPYAVGAAIFLSCSVQVFQLAILGSPGFSYICRIVSLFMVKAYFSHYMFGIHVSWGMQFYRSAYLLRPISIFGFGSLEAWVILINCVVAWLAHEVIINKSVPKSLYGNPLVYLFAIISIWLILAGIITGASSYKTSVNVSTIEFESGLEWNTQTFNMVGDVTRARIQETGCHFIVLPHLRCDNISDELNHLTCTDLVRDFIAPNIKGLGAYVSLVGSPKLNHNGDYEERSFTINPKGEIERSISNFCKYDIMIGRVTCKEWDEISHTYSGPAQDISAFGTVIGNDLERIDRASITVDRGSSIILSPSDGLRATHPSVAIVKAVENRVAIVRSDIIVDPFGETFLPGTFATEIKVSEPLKINWARQHLIYWLFIVSFVVFFVLDMMTLRHRMKGAQIGESGETDPLMYHQGDQEAVAVHDVRPKDIDYQNVIVIKKLMQ